jgi:sulfur carrier protein ThiS
MSDTLKDKRIQRVIIERSKTVAELLLELNLSKDHVVLVEGEKVPPDFQLSENERVVILPLIAGG